MSNVNFLATKVYEDISKAVDDGYNLIKPNKYRPDKHKRYWNCPIRFIPDNVYGLVKKYDAIKLLPNMPLPKYSEISPRFMRAIQYFETKSNEYTILAMKEK